MNLKLLRFLMVILSIVLIESTYGQGCSDAGFCTMDSFQPNSSDSLNQGDNQFKLGLSYGAADHDISVIGAYIEYNKAITTKLGIDAKITMLSQKDDFNSEFGLSDLFINANYRVSKTGIITLGTKIPLTNGNSMKDGRPLPMDFQPSLGTFI